MIMICQLLDQWELMSKYLVNLLSGKLYFSLRETIKMIISAFLKDLAKKLEKQRYVAEYGYGRNVI